MPENGKVVVLVRSLHVQGYRANTSIGKKDLMILDNNASSNEIKTRKHDYKLFGRWTYCTQRTPEEHLRQQQTLTLWKFLNISRLGYMRHDTMRRIALFQFTNKVVQV